MSRIERWWNESIGMLTTVANRTSPTRLRRVPDAKHRDHVYFTRPAVAPGAAQDMSVEAILPIVSAPPFVV